MELPPINKTDKPTSLQNQGKQDVRTKKIEGKNDYAESVSCEFLSTEEITYVNMIGDIVSDVSKACDEDSITDELLDQLKEKLQEFDKLEEDEEKEIQDSLSSNETPEIEEPIKRNYIALRKKRKQHLSNHLQSLISSLEKYYHQCVDTGNCPEAFIEKLRKTIIYLKGCVR